MIYFNDKKEPSTIVLVDECGDTLWDAVLEQNVEISSIDTSSSEKK